jgi:hypothetical protein
MDEFDSKLALGRSFLLECISFIAHMLTFSKALLSPPDAEPTEPVSETAPVIPQVKSTEPLTTSVEFQSTKVVVAATGSGREGGKLLFFNISS